MATLVARPQVTLLDWPPPESPVGYVGHSVELDKVDPVNAGSRPLACCTQSDTNPYRCEAPNPRRNAHRRWR